MNSKSSGWPRRIQSADRYSMTRNPRIGHSTARSCPDYHRDSQMSVAWRSRVDFSCDSQWLLRRKLTLRSDNPFSRFTEMSANWGPLRSVFRSPVAVTLPSRARHSVIPAEQALHNQKYSGVLTLDDLKVRSASSRNSLPSCR